MHIADVNAEAVEEITRQSKAISGSVGDISSAADLDVLFADVQSHLSGLGVLVNNAGIAGAREEVERATHSGNGHDATLEDALAGGYPYPE